MKLGNGTFGLLTERVGLETAWWYASETARRGQLRIFLARLGTRDSLVVAIAWLAYGAGAADDDIV